LLLTLAAVTSDIFDVSKARREQLLEKKWTRNIPMYIYERPNIPCGGRNNDHFSVSSYSVSQLPVSDTAVSGNTAISADSQV